MKIALGTVVIALAGISSATVLPQGTPALRTSPVIGAVPTSDLMLPAAAPLSLAEPSSALPAESNPSAAPRADESLRAAAEPAAVAGAAFDGQAAVGEDRLAALNAAVVDILAPYNDAASRATLVFSRVGTDDRRATDVAFTLHYSKQGAGGQASLNVDEFSYSYPQQPDAKPQTRAQGSVKVPLLNLLSQRQIDQMGPQADKLVKEFAAQMLRQYGDAATVKVLVTKKDIDLSGSITALGLSFDLDVDLARLPARVDPKSEIATAVHATVDIDLKGVNFSLNFTANPGARQFDRDQVGLKETLDGLLARDPKSLANVTRLMGMLAQFADRATTAPRRNVAASLRPALSPVAFPEPGAALAKARAAAAGDAQLISADANLRDRSQAWSYLFYSAATNEYITVSVEGMGQAIVTRRMHPHERYAGAPIDPSSLATLARARDAAAAAGLTPVYVSLERDFHGRILYRFLGADETKKVLVDAVSGLVVTAQR